MVESSCQAAFSSQNNCEYLFGIEHRMTRVKSQGFVGAGFGQVGLTHLEIRQGVEVPTLRSSFWIEFRQVVGVIQDLLPVAALSRERRELFVRKYKFGICGQRFRK